MVNLWMFWRMVEMGRCMVVSGPNRLVQLGDLVWILRASIPFSSPPKNRSILHTHTHARARARSPPIYSRTAFGVTIAGEFSNGFNDCGLFIRGVGGSASSAANCTFWNDITQWDDNSKAGLMNFAMASMDALGDWFFWTWKVRFVFLFFLFIDFSFSFSLDFVRRLETPQQQGKSTPPCGPTN